MLFRARVHPAQSHSYRDKSLRTLSLPLFAVAVALFAMCFAGSLRATSEARFAAAASLQAMPPTSSDGRFAMSAKLQPEPVTRSKGRFIVDANLNPKAGASAMSTACASLGIDLFKNSFETP